MAHEQQRQFLLSVKEQFPEKFQNCSVLDIGSLDINGNNRYLFSDYVYIGLDIGEGKNVDVVCRGHKYESDKQFDIVISTECFEHDEFWYLTIENGIRLTKSNGMFLFTCATTGRPEHGTRRTTPSDSPFTCQLENDYYQNLTEKDIRSKIAIEDHFSKFEFKSITGCRLSDLYFWGIKK
jgi:hypothetical protein